MSELSVYLFGPPRVECDGVVVEIGRRKAVAILAYLAVSGSRQSRNSLAALFWPDYAAEQARAALRRDLAALTTVLPRGVLHTDRETVGLAHPPQPVSTPNVNHQANTPIWLDVAHFRNRLAVCRSHGHAADEVCPRCVAPLSDAVQLYRADFLAGFSLRDSPDFDEWQREQTEGLGHDLARALERLVRAYCGQGDYALAIPYARRWVALDPLHEPAHRALMQLFDWTDQFAAAMHQYEVCAGVLAAELGVTPSDETTELQQSLKDRHGRHPGTSTVSPYLPKLPAFLEADTHRDPEEALFVAREQELACLDQFLQLALAGQGRMAFVTGEAGSGKTGAASGVCPARPSCTPRSGGGDRHVPSLYRG